MSIIFLPACIYVHHTGFPGTGIVDGCETWMLRIEPWSSAKANAHNCWAIAPDPEIAHFKESLKSKQFREH